MLFVLNTSKKKLNKYIPILSCFIFGQKIVFGSTSAPGKIKAKSIYANHRKRIIQHGRKCTFIRFARSSVCMFVWFCVFEACIGSSLVIFGFLFRQTRRKNISRKIDSFWSSNWCVCVCAFFSRRQTSTAFKMSIVSLFGTSENERITRISIQRRRRARTLTRER